MKELIKNIDAKMMTAGGGILLAAFAIYVMWDMYKNQLRDLSSTVSAQRVEELQAKKDLNEVLTRNAVAIEGNTKVIEQFVRLTR